MILDIAAFEHGATVQADLCIVGAGAAGLSIALAFEGTRTQVVVLDAGGKKTEPQTQMLAEGELAPGCRHPPPHRYRPRRFGGATTLWGGRCMPLDPIDLEARDWVPLSGWPIRWNDLARHYPAANALCEAGDFDYAAPAGLNAIVQGFRPGHFTQSGIERFSSPTDFGARYRDRLVAAPNIRIVLHANATNIRTSADDRRVTGIELRSLAGRRLSVVARDTVLAMGGLEIPRLLLASGGQNQAGLGNAHDRVGRTYMCHLAGTLGTLLPAGAVEHGYAMSPEGVYCRRRFALTEAAQRALRCGNMIARLHHPRIADPSHRSGALSLLRLAAPFIAPEYATRLNDGAGQGPTAIARHAANILADPLHTAGFLAHWVRHRTLAARKFPSIIVRPPDGAYSLDVHAEQMPNPQSRVVLTRDRDALGLPRLRVDWRHLPADIDTVRCGLRALSADLAVGQAARLDWDDDALEELLLRDGAYGGHHIGTARMAADPKHGVVDADCRVHGMANLWIAGSAVFPTSGQANPTLTIVALALRLAEHLGAACRVTREAPRQAAA